MYRGIMIMVMVIFISVTKSLRKVHMCDSLRQIVPYNGLLIHANNSAYQFCEH